ESALGRNRYLAFLAVTVLAGGFFHGVAHFTNLMALAGFTGTSLALLVGAAMIAPHRRVMLYFVLPLSLRTLAIIMLVLQALALVDSRTCASGGHLVAAGAGGLFLWWVRNKQRPGGNRRPPRGPRKGTKTVRSKRWAMGHPGRHANASDLYDDPHWRLDQ